MLNFGTTLTVGHTATSFSTQQEQEAFFSKATESTLLTNIKKIEVYTPSGGAPRSGTPHYSVSYKLTTPPPTDIIELMNPKTVSERLGQKLPEKVLEYRRTCAEKVANEFDLQIGKTFGK